MIPRSKNKELIQNIEERRERYSIRKFSAGAASVLIGISFMGMANSQVVKADTQPASNDENHETKVSAPSTDGVNTSDANAKVVVSVNNSSSQNSDKNKAVNNAQSENDSAQTTAETKTDEAKTNTRTEQNDSTQTFDVRNAGSQGMSAQAVNDQKTADQTLKQNAEKTATTENQSKTDQKEYDTEPITNKSVTRTVTLNAPKGGSYTDKNGNKSETATQTDTINYTRKISQDKATKKWIIDTDWTADQNHPDGKFAKQEIQTFPGYKPSSSNLNIEEDEGKFYISETGVEKDADGNLKDSQYSIDFEALQETAKLNFIANDDKKTIVSSQEISGKTGDEVALSLDGANGSTKLDVPTNWKIVPNTPYPTSITIRPNASADIYVEHATTTTSEQVQVTRTITKKIQDKTIGTATQTLSFTRNQVTDTVTGQPTYTDWKSNTVDNNNNPISQYPEIDVSYTGYIPTTDKGSIINKDGKYYLAAANAETDSTGKPINTNVTVSYTADQNVKFTQVVNYMNGTTNVGSFSISGNAGETVNDVTKQIEDHVPTNYEIVPNTKVISTITFGNENPDPVNVQVQPKQTPVDPNKDPQNQIRQVTRKITIQMPGQAAQDMGTQGVTYYRSGTKDDVTGKITYGEWKVATNSETNKPFDQVWAAYNLTQAGYTPTAIDRDNNNAAVTLTNENGKIELPQVNVTPDTKSQDILVTYTANSHKYVINYVDNTTKQNVGSQTVEGKTGEKVSYTLQYPAGYKLANVTQNIPAGTITFGSNDPAASTVLVEKDSSTTPDNPDQTYTYTINYANNGQTVGSQNVTGKSGQQVQITLRVPEGYKLTNGTQYPTSYTFGNQNASTTVQVEKDSTTPVDPNQEVKQVINYVYNGQTVGSQTLTGKIGTTKDIDWKKTGKGVEPKIPEHYTLVAQKLYGQFTFHENAEPIVAQVEPKTTIIDGSKETNNRNFYRDITQTINYNYPNQKADPVVSHRIFVRNGSRNDVTGEVTYTDWVTSGGDFIARPVQNIPGYTVQVTNGDGQVVQLVNGQIPAQTVNADSPDTIYNIDYTAQTLSFKINYVSQANNQTVKSYTISGKPDETVQIDAPVPEHWQVVSGQKILAGSYKFGNEAPSDMNVLIQPQTISGNQEGQQNNPDLYQKVTETVNITGPSGETQSRDQSLVFYRSQTFDPSTNKWNYSEWQSNMSNKATTFSPVSFTNLDGYTFKVETNDGRTITPVINGNMASIENVSGLVNGTPANVTINVTYVNKDTGKPDNPDNPQADYTYTINYMNGSENVGTQEVTGKAGQQVQITLNVPNGYKLANVAQYPTSYTFGNQNASTTVQVVKNDSTNPVNPNNPDATYTMPVQYLNAADNNAQVGSYTISGKAGQTINVTEDIKKNIPTNYEIVSGSSVPTTITFGNSNLAPALIYVQPKVENVTDDPTLKNQTEKTISRQIIYKFPGQADQTTDQSVTFKRLAYKNAVTGVITYGDWSNNGTYTFNAVQLKEQNGFKPDISEIPAWTVTAEGQNDTKPVVVTFTSTNPDHPVDPNATYTYTINYRNNGQTIDSQKVTGKTGQTIQITLNVPEKYQLVSGQQLPSSVTFGNQNSSTDVQIAPKITTVNGLETKNPDLYRVITRTIQINYPNANQPATVALMALAAEPANSTSSYTNTQSITVYRTQTTNEVTGQKTYTPWQSNSVDSSGKVVTSFEAVALPQITGYKAEIDGKEVTEIPAVSVFDKDGNPISNSNITVVANYVADGTQPTNPDGTHSMVIEYINAQDNKQVGSFTVSGKSGQTIQLTADINKNIPENYEIVPNSNVVSEVTFGNTDSAPALIYVQAKQVNVTDDPSLKDQTEKTISRQIVYKFPGQADQTTDQSVTFKRLAYKNAVTGAITYGPWSNNGTYTFNAIQLKENNGFKPDISEIPAWTVTAEGQNNTNPVVVTYTSTSSDNPDQTYTYTINYMNNGQNVGSQNITGKAGQQVQITLNVPNDYKLASGAQYPTSYTFGNQNASTTVQVEKDSSTPVDPNQEVKQVINYVYNGQTVSSQTLTGKVGTTEYIDWNNTGKGIKPQLPDHYVLVSQQLPESFTFENNAKTIDVQVTGKSVVINGDEHKDDPNYYRTVTQTINYNYPNQPSQPVVSSRTFVRNATVNEVTGEVVKYSDWSTAPDFIARPVQTIPGYTVQVTNGDGQVVQLVNGQIPAEAVNENSANTVYNVNYTAQTLSFKINYINQANNQVVQSYTISGKPDQTVTINAPIPENWQVVAGQTVPKEGDYKFGNVAPSDMNVLIEPQTISGNQQGNQDNPDLYRTVNEVVNITGPNGDTQTRTQNLAFYRSKTFDPSTSNWKYGEWQSNMSNKATTFSPVSFTNLDGYTFKVETSDDRTVTPVINGNTASIEDVSGLVNGSPTNITINVAYINKYTGKPDNPESTYTYTINYMSNGQNVGMQNVTGKAGQTVQITLNVPKGYKLANGAQVLTSYTFGTQNASTNVQVVEDNGQTPNPDQTYTYTINYLDNGQNVGTQNVTGKSGQTVQITLNLPDGYQLANGTSYPTTYTFGNQNSSTNVNVTKKSTNPDQTYSMQIQYINAQDNKQVGSFTVSGKSGQTIQLTQEIQGKVPENYEIVPNSKYPTSVTFGNSDQAPALVYVQAEQINVTDDPSLKDQTEKTISRQIVYKFPGQADQTTDQSITFKRLAYKNAVTDQITYGDWSNDGKYTFSPIQIKQQDGYTASASEIPAWTVTAEGQNDTAPVVITFTSTTPDNPDNPDQTYTYTINYVDNGQNVGTQNVTGKSGQTVQITLNVPNGYKVDGQYPTSYTFGKQNASTTVNVVKDTTPDNPGQTISGLDHKDDPSLYREVTQTITVTYPNEQPQSTTNSLIFYRTKTTKDGQTTYSKWTSNSRTADQLVYDFKEQKVTQLPGYTVNVQKDGKGLELVTKDGASYIPSQAALNANGEPENQTITITYASENLSVKINYVANNDHSKVIATQTISGKTGEHVPVNLEVPKNWQVVPNTSVPTSITITPDAKDRTVYIEHKLVTVDGRNDQSNGNLYQKVTRTIVMNYPNQKAGEATSTLEFYRIQTTDEVTGKVTYTDWTSNSVNADKQVINEYPEQNVSLDGYTATSSDVQLITKDGKQYVPATQVARNNENVPISNTIVVNYVGNEQTVEINYVNGNNLIKTQKFSGRTGQTVAVPLELPNGYEIAANVNYPTQITFGANTEKTLTIQVTPIPSGQQKQTINYVDPSGQVVGSQYVVGTIGQTVDVKASLPINWKLADGASVPSQVTIQNTDTPISVKVVSETVTINPSKPVTPGTPINSTGQTYPAGLTANDLNKTVTRTVDIVSPDGKTTTTVQKVEFSRDATLSIATGQITYGDWKAKGNKVFNAISVPVIDGYKASGKVDEVEPSADYGNQTLTITYTKVTGQQTDSDKYTPNVVNNGSVSVDVNGDLKPEDVISNKDSLPKGTTIEWSNPDQVAQDLKKAGTYKDVGVKITYPDKSTTITKVTITVQDKQSSTYTQQIIFVNQKDNKEIKSYTFEGKLTDGHAVLSVDKLKQAIEILFGDITSDAQYKNAKIVESSLPTKDIDITGPTTKPITILVNVEGTSDNRNNSGNNSNTGDNTNPINPDNPNPVNPDNNNSGNNNNNSNNSNTNNGNANNSNNNQSSNNTNNSTNENKPNNGNNSSNIDDNSGDNGDDYDDNDSDDSNEITPKRHKSHTSSNSHAATGNTGMTVAHANNARWLASHGYVVAVGPHGEVLNYYKASNGKGRIVTIAPHGENELANSSSSSVRSAGLAGVKNANETNGNSRKGKLPQTGEKDESALIGLGLIAGAGLLGLAGDRKRKRD